MASLSKSAGHLPALERNDGMDPERLRLALWVARGYYFSFFAALGALVPFFNVYLQGRGLSGSQIGLIASLPPLIALTANPFWGLVSDRWQAHRRVLAVCAFAAGLASFGFIWVNQFLTILLVLCVVNFFRTPISAILDSTVMGLIAANPSVHYGPQRVFGSFGWILASLSVGYLVGQVHIYSIFVLHGVLLGLVCAALSLRLPVQRAGERPNFSQGLRDLFRMPLYRGLLLVVFLFGVGAASIMNFSALNILRLGGSAALIGIANASSAVLEAPVMFLGPRWERVVSRRTTILLAMSGFAILWTAIGLTTDPRLIPVLMLLNGVCFALIWPATVGYAHAMAPPGLRASAQTLMQAAHGGLGWALGALIAGVMWDLNPPAVFFVAAGAALLGAVLFGLVTRGKR